MESAKHIGIVGVSAEGAALCYRTICVEAAALLGAHNHPQITMHTYALREYMRAIEANQWRDVGRLLLSSAKILVGAGAEILICPDNTVHQAIDLVREQSPTQWLDIADEVSSVASSRGFRRLGILGTRYLMEGPVYPARLALRNINYETPGIHDRERINGIIFDELTYGRFEEASKRYFIQLIDTFRQRGCDAVVLGCTEIPLLVSENDSPLPAIDSTRTLARAALRAATEHWSHNDK